MNKMTEGRRKPKVLCSKTGARCTKNMYNLLHYILFFTNHSYFDLENGCGIKDEDMEKVLMPILLL